VSSPRRQAKKRTEPGFGVRAFASQVLVPKQAHPDEGK